MSPAAVVDRAADGRPPMGRPSELAQAASIETYGGGNQMKHFSWVVFVAALLIGSVVAGHVDPAQSATMLGEDGVKALALRWFLQMQAGKIDRAQYPPAYGALLTDDAVKAMSHHLNQYGAS